MSENLLCYLNDHQRPFFNAWQAVKGMSILYKYGYKNWSSPYNVIIKSHFHCAGSQARLRFYVFMTIFHERIDSHGFFTWFFPTGFSPIHFTISDQKQKIEFCQFFWLAGVGEKMMNYIENVVRMTMGNFFFVESIKKYHLFEKWEKISIQMICYVLSKIMLLLANAFKFHIIFTFSDSVRYF